MSHLGMAAGLLHDIGKYTPEFQGRLAGDQSKVDHSTAGAKIAIDKYGEQIGKLLSFCVAGHHAGLANGTNGSKITALEYRLKKKIPQIDSLWENEIALPEVEKIQEQVKKIHPNKEHAGFCAAFLARMIFSALVDADYLDTEAYHKRLQGIMSPRGEYPDLHCLANRLNTHLHKLMGESAGGELNTLRKEILEHVKDKAEEPPGLFTLTVPTGGGKTLTSLAFALDHALRHGLTRVIYVIPYISIIEQVASVFRDALRDEDSSFVIEHHGTFDEDQISKRESREKLRLAMENWDAPIIITTTVQFFESLFSNRPSRCRKLHNISNSVVILDEAQTLPLKLLRPCVVVLDELARNYRTSIVLCTATQPALAEDEFENGFKNLRELAPDPERLYTKLKRTHIRDAGQVSDTRMAEKLRNSEQILCIVNTRKHARELYESIKGSDGAYHLTTVMCARHRSDVLASIRERLKADQPVRLIATSLVEAGVDVDFPVVWRAQAGLESIVQAAGRCNREGKLSTCDVFVFEPIDEHGKARTPPLEIEQLASAMRSALRKYKDPISLEAIRSYFGEVYWRKGNDQLDAKQILDKIEERRSSLDFPFEDMAKEFHFIETGMVPVIVRYRGECGNDHKIDELIDKLEHIQYPGELIRRLQPYTVQIPPNCRARLIDSNAAIMVRKEDFGEQFAVLTAPAAQNLYQEDTGLNWENPPPLEPVSLVY